MRPALYAALLIGSLVRTAQAAELQVLTPPLIYAGLFKLATAYTRQTGITVTVKSDVMGKIVGDIKTGVGFQLFGFSDHERRSAQLF